MNNNDIEKLIRDEFDAAAPDDFDAILKKLDDTSADENCLLESSGKPASVSGGSHGKKRYGWKYGFAAAMLAIVICSGVFGYRAVKLPADVVQLDVNPSIELTLNSFGRVLECKAINTDADPIIASFKLDGKTLPYAAEKLTRALVKAGYITDEKNSVLVSAISDSEKHAEALTEKAAGAVLQAAEKSHVEAAVLTQGLDLEALSDSDAQRLGISAGKAALVKSFKACLPEYDEKELAALSINDLGILAGEYKSPGVELKGAGKPSTSAYITANAAQSAAMAGWIKMGISPEDLTVRLTADEGKMLYIVRAENGGEIIIAWVDAATGSIINNSVDASQYAVSPEAGTPPAQGDASDSGQNGGVPDDSDTSQNGQNGSNVPDDGGDIPTPTPPTEIDEQEPLISRKDALNLALQAFAVSEDSISDVRIDKEKHKGVYVYEVRFERDKLDYKATINAATGEIISMYIF